MQPYTVVLLTPDYACGDVPYGQNLYTAYVQADHPRQALDVALREASEAYDKEIDPLDFSPAIIFSGHPAIVSHGWQL